MNLGVLLVMVTLEGRGLVKFNQTKWIFQNLENNLLNCGFTHQ